jgi:preprotein translocase subunit YajC
VQVLPLLSLVGLAIVMWLLLIRPAQRKNRELAGMQSTLEVGDEVMLTSGVYGVLRSIDDKDVRVEVADGVILRVALRAVGQVVTPAEDPDDSTDPHTPDTDDSEVSEEN